MYWKLIRFIVDEKKSRLVVGNNKRGHINVKSQQRKQNQQENITKEFTPFQKDNIAEILPSLMPIIKCWLKSETSTSSCLTELLKKKTKEKISPWCFHTGNQLSVCSLRRRMVLLTVTALAVLTWTNKLYKRIHVDEFIIRN